MASEFRKQNDLWNECRSETNYERQKETKPATEWNVNLLNLIYKLNENKLNEMRLPSAG